MKKTCILLVLLLTVFSKHIELNLEFNDEIDCLGVKNEHPLVIMDTTNPVKETAHG